MRISIQRRKLNNKGKHVMTAKDRISRKDNMCEPLIEFIVKIVCTNSLRVKKISNKFVFITFVRSIREPVVIGVLEYCNICRLSIATLLDF